MKWQVIGFTFVGLGVLTVVLFWGVQPKPIRLINPTSLDQLDEAGALIYRRLQPIFKQNQVFVFGSSPQVTNYQEIWKGILLTGANDGWRPARVIEVTGVRSLKEIFNLEVQLTAAESLREALPSPVDLMTSSMPLLFHTTYNLSSHFFNSSWTLHLEKHFGSPVVSFTLAPFVVERSQLSHLEAGCPEGQNVMTAEVRLGCTSVAVSRRYFRKRLDPKRLQLALEQHGKTDYIIYIYQPL